MTTHTASNSGQSHFSPLSHFPALLCPPPTPAKLYFKCLPCLTFCWSMLAEPSQILSPKMSPGTEHTGKNGLREMHHPLDTSSSHYSRTVSHKIKLVLGLSTIRNYYSQPDSQNVLECAKHCFHIQDGKPKSPRNSAMPGMTQWKKPALSVDGLQCFLFICYRSGFLKVLGTDRHEFYYIRSPGQGHNMIKVLTYMRLYSIKHNEQ